jgi:hypothetical protein
VGSDKSYLSNKIRTLYSESEFTAILTARIGVKRLWFLCPVLIYHKLVVPKEILDPTVLSLRMLTILLNVKCKETFSICRTEKCGNTCTVMMLQFVIAISNSSEID